MRGATLFSGGGGVEALLGDAIDFRHAVEHDAPIAEVYRRNIGDHVTVADVCDVDYAAWGPLDYLHASPVCKNASVAKAGGEESDDDLRSAEAVCRAIRATEPRVFTLENVGGYRAFAAYRRICQTLDDLGYMWHAEIVNAADYGVPQTRRRLILRAVRDALLPPLPAPQPWVGWYAAIEDLIPTLPPSQFAPWQLARLPELSETTIVEGDTAGPRPIGTRNIDSPIFTIKATTSPPRAFVVDCQDSGHVDGLTMRAATAPMYTISASMEPRRPARAWLVDTAQTGRDPTARPSTEPAMTIQAWHGRRPSQAPRAWLAAGRVVKLTPRALARLQSFPDAYALPDSARLACTIIGNAVPPLLMRQIVRQLI